MMNIKTATCHFDRIIRVTRSWINVRNRVRVVFGTCSVREDYYYCKQKKTRKWPGLEPATLGIILESPTHGFTTKIQIERGWPCHGRSVALFSVTVPRNPTEQQKNTQPLGLTCRRSRENNTVAIHWLRQFKWWRTAAARSNWILPSSLCATTAWFAHKIHAGSKLFPRTISSTYCRYY